MDKLVSVIVPCYNGEQFVDRCFTSIFNQDYKNIEIIVVNDGSTDQSEKTIVAWKDRFDETEGRDFIYVKQENQGPGGAINTGLKYVNGEYLILLDVDDEFLPEALSSKAEFLDEHSEVDVVRSNGWYVRESGKSLFIYNDSEKKLDDVFTALIAGKTNNWAGSYMMRTSSLFAFYPNREIFTSRYGQNLQFLLPLTYKKKCGFIDMPQMNYNIQSNSLSHSSDSDRGIEFALKNGAGYRDIRLHMISDIVKNPMEAEYFNCIAEANYQRFIMNSAAMLGNRKVVKKAFIGLKTFVSPELDDLIVYCRSVRPFFVFPLRAVRKLKSILSLRNR